MGTWAPEMTKNQFINKSRPIVNQQVMSEVYNLLLYQYAKRELDKLEIDEETLDNIVADRKKDFLAQYDGSEARARTELAQNGDALEEKMEEIKRSIIIAGFQDMHFIPTLTITRSQILQYYRKHLHEEFYQKPTLQFQLIDIKKNAFNNLQASIDAAHQALKKIKDGADFAQVVNEFSHGFRKNHGGLWRPVDDPDSIRVQYKPVVEALKKIEIGQTTGIIETDNRFFIAKLIDRKKGKFIPFTQAQAQIAQILRQQRWEEYRKKLLTKLLKQSSFGNPDQFIQDTIIAAYEQLK